MWPCRHNNIPRPRTTSPQTRTLLLLLCGAWVVPTSIAYPAIKLCSSYLCDDVCACACAHAACVYMHVWNNRRRGCPVTLLSPSSSQNTAPSDQSTTSQRRTHTLLRVLAVLVYSCKKSACTVFLLHRQMTHHAQLSVRVMRTAYYGAQLHPGSLRSSYFAWVRIVRVYQ